ncbi:MAG: methyltransferase domain-containing protein [Candidatus Paceibacterota bacterium]
MDKGNYNIETGATRDELFNHLKNETRVLQNAGLEDAFDRVDRADFVAGDYISEAYEDYPLPIAGGSTISQPTTVAFMLELLEIQEGERVLDVGSGSGWTTALIASLVGEEGSVLGIEIQPELVEFGRRNIQKYPYINAVIEDAHTALLREESFNKILVSAELQDVPEEFIRALADEGMLLAPLDGSLVLFRKRGDELVEEKRVEGFAFVPYVHTKDK